MSATTFALAQLTAPGPRSALPEIIFDLRLSASGTHLLASLSSGDLCLLDPATLQIIKRWRAHSQRITDVNFVGSASGGGRNAKNSSMAGNNSSFLGEKTVYSVGMDGAVCWWDLRTNCKTPFQRVNTDKVLTTAHLEPFGSNLLATGSEKQNHQTEICFWDVRQNGQPVGQWTETHTDDITMIRFHPREAGRLVSASVDGLVCCSNFDAILNPDESLQTVLQTGCAVDAFSFVPTSQYPDLVISRSPIETVCWGGLDSSEIYGQLGDIRKTTGWDTKIIAIESNDTTDSPLLFTGNEGGDVGVWMMNGGEEVVEVGRFGGVHSDSVRACLYLPEYNTVFTGGEDSKLVGWSINN